MPDPELMPSTTTRERLGGAAIASLAVLLAACTGLLGDAADEAAGSDGSGGGGGDDTAGTGTTPDGDPLACGFAPTPLSRLTRREYDHTVVDLLRLDPPAVRPSEGMPEDDAVEGFPVGLGVTPLHVEKLEARAEQLAAAAMAHPERIVPCDLPPADEEACAAEFVDAFGARAYRRPLDEAEREALLELYAVGREGGDRPFLDGIELVVHGALMAPQFWYHGLADPGAEAGVEVELRDHALANRLSYFLWSSMPDEALFAAADAGALVTSDDVRREARRMLDDPRAHEAMYGFFDALIGLDDLAATNKDQTVYPEYEGATSIDLARSLSTFLDDAVFGVGTFDALFASRKAFANERLAAIYGVEAQIDEGSGDALVEVELDPAQRMGLLTQPGVLAVLAKADSSDPIHRGVFVRRKILCQELEAPPPSVDTAVPPPDPDATTRERFAAHTADPSCAGCHGLIDPIGFPFESYDGTGAFRTTENGLPIDTSGELVGTTDADGPVADAVELAERLAGSADVKSCFASHVFHVATKRGEVTDDACWLGAIVDRFAETGDLRELLVETAASEAFRTVVVPVGAERAPGADQ